MSFFLWLLAIHLLVVSIVITDGGSSVDFKDGVMVTETKYYLQLGQTQRLPCASVKNRSDVVVFLWYKLEREGRGAQVQIIRFAEEIHGGNYSSDARYSFAPDFSLVIAGVEIQDGGFYICQMVSLSVTEETHTVELVIFDKLFPPVSGIFGDERVKAKIDKGTQVSCPILEEDSSYRNPTIYWSSWDGGSNRRQTKIIVARFSDGDVVSSEGFSISQDHKLTVAASMMTEDRCFLCHVSSVEDGLNLKSAKVTVNVEVTNSGSANLARLIIPIMSCILLLLLVAAMLVYKYRFSIKKRFHRPTDLPTEEPTPLAGPQINTGQNDIWMCHSIVGPEGRQSSAEFDSLKTVLHLDGPTLAVLDNGGLRVFSDELFAAPGTHIQLQPPVEDYITMAQHHGGLLLGTRRGDITQLNVETGERKHFCTLPTGDQIPQSTVVELDVNLPDSEGSASPEPTVSPREEAPFIPDDGQLQSSPSQPVTEPFELISFTTSTPMLSGIAVDENGYVFAADSTNKCVVMSGPDGVFLKSISLGFAPGCIATCSAGEVLVHSGISGDHVYKVTASMRGAASKKTVVIPGSPVLKPLRLVAADHSSLFILNDIPGDREQRREVLQYGTDGIFLRQIVSPWPELRGICPVSTQRLIVYDERVFRVYDC